MQPIRSGWDLWRWFFFRSVLQDAPVRSCNESGTQKGPPTGTCLISTLGHCSRARTSGLKTTHRTHASAVSARVDNIQQHYLGWLTRPCQGFLHSGFRMTQVYLGDECLDPGVMIRPSTTLVTTKRRLALVLRSVRPRLRQIIADNDESAKLERSLKQIDFRTIIEFEFKYETMIARRAGIARQQLHDSLWPWLWKVASTSAQTFFLSRMLKIILKKYSS